MTSNHDASSTCFMFILAMPHGNGNTRPLTTLEVALLIGGVALSVAFMVTLGVVGHLAQKRKRAANAQYGVPILGRLLLLETVTSYGEKARYRFTVEIAPTAVNGESTPFTTTLTATLPVANLASVQVGKMIWLRMVSRDNIEVAVPGAEP